MASSLNTFGIHSVVAKERGGMQGIQKQEIARKFWTKGENNQYLTETIFTIKIEEFIAGALSYESKIIYWTASYQHTVLNL